MSAQGEDILAWLEKAIGEREDAARAAEVISPSPWAAGRGEDASVTHIAANDPASVLRRCAADRKLLELHAPTTGYNVHGGSYPACSACGAAEEYPVRFPCPTVRVVAEGYGWTEG